MCVQVWCVPDPSSTLVCLSLLPCARYWCARQRETHTQALSTHAASQSDDALAHPVSVYFLFLSTCLEPFHEPQPDNSRSFPVPSFATPVQLDTLPRLHTAQHPVPCIDCSAARLHRAQAQA